MIFHGMHKTSTYGSWENMIQRCENPNYKWYHRYGGREIKVCSRWRNSFHSFFEDMGEKPKGLTLERIDNDGDYTPENCKWATWREQANNRRSNRNITINKETKNITEWSHIVGVSSGTISARIRLGWLPDKAVLTPTRSRKINP